MYNSGQISTQAEAAAAVINIVVSNPDAYFSPGSPITDSFNEVSTGSGFFVNENGYLVTAAHVVSADKSEVRAEAVAITKDPSFVTYLRGTITKYWAGNPDYPALTDGQVNSLLSFYQRWIDKYLAVDKIDVQYYPSVVSIDPTATGHDIAIMKADVTGVPTLQLAADSAHLGMATYAIGYPRKAYLQESVPEAQTVPATMTSGQVLLVDPRKGGWTAWGTSAQFTPGDSGGPVIGPDGAVVGVISYKQVDAQGNQSLGSGFFVPSQYIAADLSSQGITVASGPKTLTSTYYHALAEGDVRRYKTELLLLEDIQSRSPFDAYVKDDITSTQSQILAGNDKTPPQFANYVPAAAASGGVVALLAIVVWIGMGIAGRRRRPALAMAEPVAETTAESLDPHWSEPATDMVSSPQEVLRESKPIAQSDTPTS